jgi:hypothetical protein
VVERDEDLQGCLQVLIKEETAACPLQFALGIFSAVFGPLTNILAAKTRKPAKKPTGCRMQRRQVWLAWLHGVRGS